jgi:hypothetical protein
MATETYLGGASVTQYVQEGSVTESHNAPDTATVKLPSDYATAGDTAYLDVIVDGDLRFHGSVEYIEHQGDENTRYTTYTAIDPTFMWNWRVAADADGDYTKPTFLADFVTGPQIMQAIIGNSITQFGDIGHGVGSVASGGSNLSGAPTNWPKTIAEVATILSETGELDWRYNPTTNLVDFYNGNLGADLSGSVSFSYGSGGNSRACRVTSDKREMVNRPRWLFGPRLSDLGAAKLDQHWSYSIDRTTMVVPNIGTINVAASASEAAYLTRFQVRILDSDGRTDDVRMLGRAMFAAELWMRLKPKLMFHITPHRGIAPSFRPGDVIAVSGFGLSGVQRVMDMSYRWTADGPIELGEPMGQAGAHAISTTSILEGL